MINCSWVLDDTGCHDLPLNVAFSSDKALLSYTNAPSFKDKNTAGANPQMIKASAEFDNVAAETEWSLVA